MKYRIIGLAMTFAGMLATVEADTWTTATAGQITSGNGTKVGVGNGAPAAQLDVTSNTSGREALIVNQVQGTTPIARFRQNGTTRLIVTNAGQVGVGTASPARTLDVVGSIRGTAIEGNGVYPVAAYGAVADNNAAATRTANTTAFQAALNAAAPTGGIVLVPPGNFHISGNLSVPTGVTLQGSFTGPHDAWINNPAAIDNRRGSVLSAYAGQGSATGAAFITLGMDATIAGVTIHYPNQAVPGAGAYTPIAFPFTISGWTESCVMNVTLANSYQGIGFTTPHAGHTIINTNITALSRAIVIDGNTDVGRIEGTEVHNKFFWNAAGLDAAAQTSLLNWTRAQAIGIQLGRSDGEFITDSYIIWCHYNLYVDQMADPNNILSHFKITSTMFEDGMIFLGRVHPQVGCSFDNSSIFGGGFQIGGNNQGPISVNNCAFTFTGGSPNNLIDAYGTGNLSLANCRFFNWVDVAIAIHAGSALISNADFFLDVNHRPQIHTYPGALATVMGARMPGGDFTIIDPGSILLKYGILDQ